eukprot:c20569_g1_i1 orf=910-1596(+)
MVTHASCFMALKCCCKRQWQSILQNPAIQFIQSRNSQMITVRYIFDKERGEGFFLSAVIYTNSNGILNDDKYEYEAIADRVMADLGEMVARAVWKIPPTCLKVSTCFDCVPCSSLKNLQGLQQGESTSDGGKICEVETSTSVTDVGLRSSNELQSPQYSRNTSDGGDISKVEVSTSESLQQMANASNGREISEVEASSYSTGYQVDAFTQECESAGKIISCYKYFLKC